MSDFQKINIIGSTDFDSEGKFTVTVAYESSSANTNGVGYKLHFDGDSLEVDSVNAANFSGSLTVSAGNQGAGSYPVEGHANEQELVFSYASTSGTFPGLEQATLATITFSQKIDGLGNTDLYVTPTSTAAGYVFSSDNSFALNVTSGTIDENTASGAVVATVNNGPSGATYSLIDHTIYPSGPSQLSIDSTTGEVSITSAPNYESLPAYDFEIVANNGAFSTSTSVAVVDLDEVAAVFDSATATNTVAEDASIIFTAQANDSFDISAGVTYSLSGTDADLLNINENTGEVTVVGGVDYEAKASYSFTVVVSDNINAPGPDSEQDVTVTITNVDDSAPVFTSSAEVSVSENSGANQVIYSAIAEDDASDVTSGPIVYSLVDDANGAFTMDSDGNVSLLANPDYETQSSYSFAVRATDGNNNSVDQVVTLLITNIVVEKPIFDETIPDPVIDENTEFSYTAVASVDSQAADQGVGETIVYSLSDDANGTFVIDAVSGVVSMTVAADYEQSSNYSFTVVATDDADNYREKIVTVKINNVDEVAPSFAQDAITLDPILENTGAGQVIYTAQANDSGDMSEGVTYSFASYPSNTSASPALLDNTQHVYISEIARSADGGQLTAVVSYNSSTPETTGLGLRIHFDSSAVSLNSITDALGDDVIFTSNQAVADIGDADNNPDTDSFVDAAWASVDGDWPDGDLPANLMTLTFDVNDILTPSTVIGISAIDSSQGFEFDAQNVTVQLAALTAMGSLTIDPVTGEVVLLDNPDYENTNEYNFSLLATDAAGNQSNPLAVNLAVSDEQLGISSEDIAQAIDENSGAGQVVYNTTVSGVEHETNINYSLLTNVSVQQGAIEQRFVENQDGSITLQLFVSPSLLSNYPNSLENFDLVIGYDHQSITQSAVTVASEAEHAVVEETVTGEIKISTIFLDELPNITDNPLVELDFELGVGVGSAEFSVTDILIGTDHNPLQDSVSRYYDSRGFEIDAETGDVSLIDSPDYESKSNYIFSVMATDPVRGQSDIKTVTLDINNVDDTAPVVDYIEEIDGLLIVENTGANQHILTATANDASDVSDGFSLSLAGADAGLFAIDGSTGVVTLLENPNYEAKTSYNLTVVATDVAGNIGQKEVTVTVVNVDDTAPVITSDASVAVDENIGSNQIIYTAQAVDTDYSGEEQITYSLDVSSDSVFTINAVTGEVTLAIDPDYEAQDQYSFTVIATDSSNNQSEAKTVSLSINDLDDFVLTGKVYHWATQSLMDNVSVSMHHKDGNQHIDTVATNAAGGFEINELAADEVVVSAHRELQAEDTGRLVTSLDALAALKIAVGLNPNRMDDSGHEQIGISAYQFLAADVNESGKVTSADALEILRMAVRTPDAFDRKWVFVDEAEDVWDETANDGQGALSVNRFDSSMNTSGAVMTVEEASEKNFVGVLLGDVYSNWQAPADSHSMDYSNFVDLENSGTAPMYQWGLSPLIIPLEIDSGITAASIVENSGASQAVYTVTSNVEDATYSLGAGGDSSKFEIDPSSGVVTLTENPDFETQQTYSFEVIASASDDRVDSQTVTLDINNVDDTAPTITSNNTAEVEENIGANQVVYTATAEDNASDIVVSGDITFSLSGANADIFTISEQTGEVSLALNPDFESQNQYSFDVVATDSAGNASQAKTVTLNVADVDDTPPVITSNAIASVVENSGVNQIVYTATASDNSDGELTYSILGNLGVVLEEAPELQASTQHIYVSKRELSQDGNQVSLTFAYLADEANLTGVGFGAHYDSNVLSLVGVSEVIIPSVIAAGIQSDDSIDYDNDSSTDKVLNFGWASVSGDFPGSTSVDLATVTFDILDASASESAINFVASSTAANYTLDAPSYDNIIPEADVFTIDNQSGAVTLLVDPDFEAKSEYSFDITATDSAGNVSAPKTITLNIEDADEIAPVFASETVTLDSVDEGVGVGEVVYTAAATDADNVLSYSLSGDDASAFSIDSATGVITLNSQTDYAVQSSYSFAVTATDTAGNSSQPQVLSLAVNESIPAITSNNVEVITDSDSLSQVVYAATSNISDASFSFIDGTVYPPAVDTDITIPELQDQTQHVYVSDSEISLDGSQVTVTVSHNAMGALLGLGLRIHYDSNVLTLSDINDVLQANLISPPIVDVLADTSDLDGDSATDSYVIASWAAVSDAAWTLDYPDVLATFTFDIQDPSAESAVVNFSSSGTTVGYNFAGQAQNVALTVEIPPESEVTIPQLQAATQHVYVSESTKSQDGTQETVVISYNSDASALTGLGLKVYFDSSLLSVESLTNVFSENNLFSFADPASDVSDDDGDASTDMYLTLAWASADSDWPGSLPKELASVTFNILDQEVASSTLNFVSNGTAVGYAFDGLSHDIVISVEEAPPLSIDSATGAVTLNGVADYQNVSNYNFTVTADNGTDSVSQDVGLVVADVLVTSGSYQGTDNVDVIALGLGSAEVTSGNGEDVFAIAQSIDEWSASAHTLTDFDSSSDTIDVSAALLAAGYTGISSAEGVEDNQLNQITNVSSDVLDLISGNDSSLDNAIGSYFDDASNVLTIFADSDASAGSSSIESIEISVGDSSTVEEDDLTLTAFIA